MAKRPTEPMSGLESSVLAFLACSLGSIDEKTTQRMLQRLSGIALEIGNQMCYPKADCPENVRRAAQGFFDWAESLSKDKKRTYNERYIDKYPPPPGELMGAYHDPIHKELGMGKPPKIVRVKPKK